MPTLADKKAAESTAQAQKKAEAAAKRQATAQKAAQAIQRLAESETILARFRALPEPAQAETLAAFLATDTTARSAYKRKGFDSPLFLFPFAQYLKGMPKMSDDTDDKKPIRRQNLARKPKSAG